MFEKVQTTIARYCMISRGDNVLVGVSGGPDSLALTHVLARLAKDKGYSIHIAHLNHMFRGKDADEDAETVKSFSKKLGIPCTIEKRDVPAYIKEHKVSAQVGAREVRYAFFERLALQIGAKKIATGHQADDQAETVLLNFLRGTGLAGLSGIPPVREGRYIRPLIDISRAEIDEYCKKHHLPVRQDQSNRKNIYLRNKVRNELLPFLQEEFNPQISQVINRLSVIVREDNDYIDNKVKIAWQELNPEINKDKIVFNLKSFCELATAIQRRIILKAWGQINDSERDLGFIHVEELLQFLHEDSTTGIIELPKDVKVRKIYDQFHFFVGKVESIRQFEYKLNVPGETTIPDIGLSIKTNIYPYNNKIKSEIENNTNKQVVYVDYELLLGELCVRNRRAGDRFKPLGMKGTKKLKDYFIDRKIPMELRNKYPIIISGGTIVWVGGMHLDDRFKVTHKTKNVIRIKINMLDIASSN